MPNTNLTELFTGIADSIRAKDGTTDTITASDFPNRIAALPTGSDFSSSNLNLYITASSADSEALELLNNFKSTTEQWIRPTTNRISSGESEGTGFSLVTQGYTDLAQIGTVDNIQFIVFFQNGSTCLFWIKGMPLTKISDSIFTIEGINFLYNNRYSRTEMNADYNKIGFNIEKGYLYQDIASKFYGAFIIGYTK